MRNVLEIRSNVAKQPSSVRVPYEKNRKPSGRPIRDSDLHVCAYKERIQDDAHDDAVSEFENRELYL